MADHANIYIKRGQSYLEAADVLIASDRSSLSLYDPLSGLLLFSIEISLKAVIKFATGTVSSGHHIERYLVDAVEQGLLVSEEIAAGVFMVAKPYWLHAPRYAPHDKEAISLPPISLMRELASMTIERCIAKIDGKTERPDFPALTIDEAIALRERANQAYEKQIAEFDPGRVYSPNEAPPIPLGTRFISPLRKL